MRIFPRIAKGILRIDKEAAEQVRSRAETKRGKSVTFEGIQQRADRKKQARIQKAQAKKKSEEKVL